MSVLVELNGDPSIDLDIRAQSNLHGRVEWKPSTDEYRVVKTDGTAVAITGTQTRPKNRSLSNIGLDDPESSSYGQPQCQWDNAAWEPAISRTAPASFKGNAVASWRLFDDSDRCWWVVVEAVSDQLVVWLHRPATIFLQQMQPFPVEDRELHRFYLPSHLVGEQVYVATPPRGNKAVLQVITDKTDLPVDSAVGAEPERYTVPWVQYVRVIDFTGTGSWPEVEGDSAWGVGIESVASLYASPYSSGTGSITSSRKAYRYGRELFSQTLTSSGYVDDPEYPFSYWIYDAVYDAVMEEVSLEAVSSADCVEIGLVESISAPVALFVNDQAELVEVSVHASVSEEHSPSTAGVLYGKIHEELPDGGDLVTSLYPSSNPSNRTNKMDRSGSFSLKVRVNGVEELSFRYDINGLITRTQTDGEWGPWLRHGVSSVYQVDDRVFDLDGGGVLTRIRDGALPFFDLRLDPGSVALLFGEAGVFSGSRPLVFSLLISSSGQVVDRGYWGENSSPNVSVHVDHDGVGRRTYQPTPAGSPYWDAGDGTHKKDIGRYIYHYLRGRGEGSYLQKGFVYQWEDYSKWLVVGYC